MSILQMKLYPKRLNNLAHLKQEKRMLIKARKETSLESMLGGQEGGAEGERDALSVILSFITSTLKYGDVIRFVFPLVRKFVPRRKKDKEEKGEENSNTLKDKILHALKNTAKEVLGGYLKWKSIELALETLWHFIHKSKGEKDK